MRERLAPPTGRHAAGVLFSVASLAAVTGVIYGLRELAPVLSLGVLYVFAVLPVALGWGLAYAVGVSIASMLAFNFFFLPPVHTFMLRDTANWAALAVYLGTGVLVSELAARSRRRAESLVAAAEERERLGAKALEAEALRRSDEVKTAVLRSVSHDLRSPLTAIKAASDGLANESLRFRPSDRLELIAAIRLEAERLDRLVGNLLDLSRLEGGQAETNPELWTIDELIGRAVDELGPQAERIAVLLPAEVPLVQVDATQVERALVNLLENALKFSPPGSMVEIGVETEAGEAIISVVDEGDGLSEDELEAVFEPFRRGSASPGRGGAGLGLAIAGGFAKANGGRLWAEPVPGRGACFRLALPASRLPERVTA